MMAATLNSVQRLPDVKLSELNFEHFDSAARISDRLCFELPVVCELPTANDTRALVMPWVLCERGTSGHLVLPRLTAPHVIAFHPLEGSELSELRRRMMWLRLADILCGDTHAPRKSRSILETFVKLHGLSGASIDSVVEWRGRWIAAGKHVYRLFEVVAGDSEPIL